MKLIRDLSYNGIKFICGKFRQKIRYFIWCNNFLPKSSKSSYISFSYNHLVNVIAVFYLTKEAKWIIKNQRVCWHLINFERSLNSLSISFVIIMSVSKNHKAIFIKYIFECPINLVYRFNYFFSAITFERKIIIKKLIKLTNKLCLTSVC